MKTLKLLLCSLVATTLVLNNPASFISNASMIDEEILTSESVKNSETEEVESLEQEVISADTATTGTYGDFSYSLENGEITLTSFNNKAATSVTIPERIDGYPVTKIGVECNGYC